MSPESDRDGDLLTRVEVGRGSSPASVQDSATSPPATDKGSDGRRNGQGPLAGMAATTGPYLYLDADRLVEFYREAGHPEEKIETVERTRNAFPIRYETGRDSPRFGRVRHN